MRQYRYFICDVFSALRFGGNQLAVFPDADGISSAEMQQIAREFNFSETSFVLPAQPPFTRKLRIFTPTAEVPFAGHPNIGTAFALATDGAFGALESATEVLFDEAAGKVAITVHRDELGIHCELRAPQQLTRGAQVSAERLASAVNLEAAEVLTSTHNPQVVSVGLPFLVAELANLEALQNARPNPEVLEDFQRENIVPDVFVYTRGDRDDELRARMFAPFDGVPEDPATGSANCALAALLTECATDGRSEHQWRVMQGVEMGRPSVLNTRTRRRDGQVDTWIGGYSVLVSEGTLTLD